MATWLLLGDLVKHCLDNDSVHVSGLLMFLLFLLLLVAEREHLLLLLLAFLVKTQLGLVVVVNLAELVLLAVDVRSVHQNTQTKKLKNHTI